MTSSQSSYFTDSWAPCVHHVYRLDRAGILVQVTIIVGFGLASDSKQYSTAMQWLNVKKRLKRWPNICLALGKNLPNAIVCAVGTVR